MNNDLIKDLVTRSYAGLSYMRQVRRSLPLCLQDGFGDLYYQRDFKAVTEPHEVLGCIFDSLQIDEDTQDVITDWEFVMEDEGFEPKTHSEVGEFMWKYLTSNGFIKNE